MFDVLGDSGKEMEEEIWNDCLRAMCNSLMGSLHLRGKEEDGHVQELGSLGSLFENQFSFLGIYFLWNGTLRTFYRNPW